MSVPETPPPVPPPPRQRTSGCAIAPLVVMGVLIGGVLLLPGLCVLFLALSDGKIDPRAPLFVLGAVIIAVMAGYEIWRRRARK